MLSLTNWDIMLLIILIALVPEAVWCVKEMYRRFIEKYNKHLVLKRHLEELKALEAQLEALKKELEELEKEENHE